MKNELNELKAPYDVVIVGSGYSGTMVAVHLARAQRGLRVALIDRSKTFERGVAYGTTDPKHLLNVPADNTQAGGNPCFDQFLTFGAPDLSLSENMKVNHKIKL